MSRSFKKQPPFMLFCQEQRQIDPTLRKKSLPEVVEICNHRWSRMGPAERKPFIKSSETDAYGATSVDRSHESDLIGKFDSTGSSLRNEKRQKISKAYLQAIMKKEIQEKINSASKLEMIQTRFHVMSIRSWIAISKTGKAIPAEIGLAEFTIQDGLIHRWCELIAPLEIPFGYSSDIQLRIKKVHQIELDCPDLSRNYYAIFQELKSLVTARSGEKYAGQGVVVDGFDGVDLPDELVSATKHNLLPIYVVPDEIEEVAQCLNCLRDHLQMDLFFPLYDLTFLTTKILENASGDVFAPPTYELVEMHLHRDVFQFTKDVCCEYHEKVDSPNCVAGCVTRLAFIICDLCCQVYHIDPKDGRHSLLQKKVSEGSALPDSQFPFLPENQIVFYDIGHKYNPDQHILHDYLFKFITSTADTYSEVSNSTIIRAFKNLSLSRN